MLYVPSRLLTYSFHVAENFSAFEVDEELLPNLREYSLANAIFWGLAEGHACEQSARRNAMDVSDVYTQNVVDAVLLTFSGFSPSYRTPPRTPAR